MNKVAFYEKNRIHQRQSVARINSSEVVTDVGATSGARNRVSNTPFYADELAKLGIKIISNDHNVC